MLARTTVVSLKKGPGAFSPRCSQEIDVSMVKACKSLLSSVGDSLSALQQEESMVDKVLHVCQRVQNTSTAMVNRNCSHAISDNSWSHPMLQLAADVHLLASLTTLWSSICDGLQSLFLRDLLSKSTDQVKAIAHQTSSLFQGCEGQLASLMSESVDKLTSVVLSLCETCGQLSLATDSCVLRLEQSAVGSSSSQLSSSVCQSFLVGCNSFVTSTLEGAVTSIENSERQCSHWRDKKESGPTSSEMSKRLSHVLSCLQALMSKTLQVQSELNQESNTTNARSPQYYATTYKRLQGVVASVSAVVDAGTLLVQCAEPIVLGTSRDSKTLERCADLIQKSLQRLLTASSYSYILSSGAPSVLSPSLNHHFKEAPDFSSSSSSYSSSSSASRNPVSSSSLSSVSSQSDASMSINASRNLTSSGTESDLTDVTLLSESQLDQIDSSVQEVSMALSLFMEHIQKTVSSHLETDPFMTPRGRQILPASPEKSVLTPAMNTARLKRMNMKRTVLLASRNENGS